METRYGSYQEQSRKTYSDIDVNDPIVYPTLGLVNEAGEVAGKIKKIFPATSVTTTARRSSTNWAMCCGI